MNAFAPRLRAPSLSLLAAVAVLGGCVVEEPLEAPPVEASAAPTVVRTEETMVVTSDEDGRYNVVFHVPEDQTSFQIDLLNISDDTPVSVVQLLEPSGAVVLTDVQMDLRRVPSVALLVRGTQSQLAYPVVPTGEALPAGDWMVTFGLYDFNGTAQTRSGVDVELQLTTKGDADVEHGAVNVHLVYVDGIEEDAALVAGVEAAIAQWKQFARDAQSLTVHVRTSVADGTLASPELGSDVFLDLSSQSRANELTMLVGDSIPDLGLYGQAGGIPGALAPSERSGIAVAARNLAGIDGEFADVEVRMLAWVLAHEVGHYVGLRHVVEDNFASFDPVADTLECDGAESCTQMLSSNLMFPFVSGIASVAALDVTSGQTAIVQAAVAVD